MTEGVPPPDEAFVDESPSEPLLRFVNPWTGRFLGSLTLVSTGLAMSIVTEKLGLLKISPSNLPSWLSTPFLIAMVLSHVAAGVGSLSTLLYGLENTGNEAAVIIRGRLYFGLKLGVFFLLCTASPWAAYAIGALFRLMRA